MARTSNTTGGAKREMDMFAGVLDKRRIGIAI